MAILEALLRFIASNIGLLLGLTQGVSQQTAHTAQETTPYRLQDATKNTVDDITNLTFGLNALHNQLTAIAAQIAAFTPTPTVVSLPVTPPTGYGGASAGDSASAVWGFVSPDSGYQMGEEADLLFNADQDRESTVAYMSRRVPYFVVSGIWSNASVPHPEYNDFPIFDLTLIDPTSTVLSVLTASNPGLTWRLCPDGEHYVTEWTTITNYEFTCLIDSAWLWAMKQSRFTTPSVAAPLWPGLAFVTLGTPVAITTGLTITEPMDGVIVNLTGEPSKASFFTFDDIVSYRNLGALSFSTDDGSQEPAVSLGFTDAIYCPRAQIRAAGVKLRTVGGVTGTITPWVISP